MKTRIDATDVRIVEELRKNARITMKELGERVHAVSSVQLWDGRVEALMACCRREGRRTIHCYRTTGDNLYFLDMYFPDMEALDAFLAEVEPLGSYELHVVLREAEDLAE